MASAKSNVSLNWCEMVAYNFYICAVRNENEYSMGNILLYVVVYILNYNVLYGYSFVVVAEAYAVMYVM